MEDTSTAGASSQPQGPEQRKMLAREYRKVNRNLTRTRTRTVTVSLALALTLTLTLTLALSLPFTRLARCISRHLARWVSPLRRGRAGGAAPSP